MNSAILMFIFLLVASDQKIQTHKPPIYVVVNMPTYILSIQLPFFFLFCMNIGERALAHIRRIAFYFLLLALHIVMNVFAFFIILFCLLYIYIFFFLFLFCVFVFIKKYKSACGRSHYALL